MSEETGPPAPEESANVTLSNNQTPQEFIKQGFQILMEAIRNSNNLPTGRDRDFYNAFETFPKLMNQHGNRILQLMNSILDHNDIQSNIRQRVLDDKTELVVEANDIILEKVANNIDEMNGIKKVVLAPPIELQTVTAQLPVNGSWNRIDNAMFSVTGTQASTHEKANPGQSISLITGKNIVRPQTFFKDKIDNSSKFPWEPRIKEKPNSQKPLAMFLEEYGDREEFSHPYECELDAFIPPPAFLADEKPIVYSPLDETPLIEVNTEETLVELMKDLQKVKVIAVDVEHHSYRTFMGITCLLQISTQHKDYLIDTLALRDKLHVLNEVFTKPDVLKIFHGADQDIEWLQRDLSVYVVGMFDTHQAAKALEFPALSLAFLLKKYCGINPNKQYQLADWRMRPLPDELKKYAREDTHYLIYIYQMLKMELGKKSRTILNVVFERSTEVCKKRYFKPVFNDQQYMELYRRCKKLLDNRQLYALRELYAWRDAKAREEDESIGYVLPKHMLLKISEALPREMQGILACCSPVPPLVRSNLLELHNIVLKAREQPLEKAIMQEDTRDRGIVNKVHKVNMNSPLHCPHYLPKAHEVRKDLPCTYGVPSNGYWYKTLLSKKLEIEKDSCPFSIFGPSDEEGKSSTSKSALLTKRFLTPNDRYKLTRSFAQADEKKKIEEEIKKEKVRQEENERTDEERIASVREHFLDMRQKFNEESKAEELKKHQEKSLVQLGGTKKRKRRDSSPDVIDLAGDDDEEGDRVEAFQTPMPSIKGHKRKSEEIDLTGDDERTSRKRQKKKQPANQQPNQSPNWQKRQQNQPQNWQNKQQNWQPQQQQQNKPKLSKKQRFRNRKREALENDKRNSQNTPQKHNQPSNSASQESPKKMSKQKHKGQQKQFGNESRETGGKNFPGKRQENKQQRNSTPADFEPYDYASVDFRQFQGGAGMANPVRNNQQNHRGKNRSKGGNGGNRGGRSSTFNIRRGRGRGH